MDQNGEYLVIFHDRGQYIDDHMTLKNKKEDYYYMLSSIDQG